MKIKLQPREMRLIEKARTMTKEQQFTTLEKIVVYYLFSSLPCMILISHRAQCCMASPIIPIIFIAGTTSKPTVYVDVCKYDGVSCDHCASIVRSGLNYHQNMHYTDTRTFYTTSTYGSVIISDMP